MHDQSLIFNFFITDTEMKLDRRQRIFSTLQLYEINPSFENKSLIL